MGKAYMPLAAGDAGEAPFGDMQTLVYAGESHRRWMFLQYCFDPVRLQKLPGGPERDIADVATIAREKIDAVMRELHGSALHRCAVVAADTRTSVQQAAADGSIAFVSKGKPKNNEEVMSTFDAMRLASSGQTRDPAYAVHSGSVLRIPGEDQSTKEFTATDVCAVGLHRKDVEAFATEPGFDEYVQAFADFYSKPPYANNGTPSVRVTDLSGGLSLPVLVKMGAVASVNGVARNDTYFPQAFASGLFTVAVGISDSILRLLRADSKNAVTQWPWLQKVVESALASR